MCVMSMVMEHYHDKWFRQYQPYIEQPFVWPVPVVSPITPAEVDEFRQLLQRAREYDREHNQADCEMESKKNLLRKIAGQMGVNIDFIDGDRLPVHRPEGETNA